MNAPTTTTITATATAPPTPITPMATSHAASPPALSAAPYFMDSVRVRRSRRAQPAHFSHSPIIKAMITNNRLADCNDVLSMVRDCESSKSDDQVCRTAFNYFAACSRGDDSE